MPAPKKNKNAVKLKDKKTKFMAYKQYCDWIASGKAKKSFVFEHPFLSITWETMEKYIRQDVDFEPIHKEIAQAQSLAHWEDIGMKMMLGEVKGCQPAIYQMFMRNKFGWDRRKNDQRETTEPLVKAIARMWRESSS
ncbi:MAG: hypothetical protein K1000chlam3_01476 [Chlamydiae bacterium]|nr:hypothetical protein [Chlamydiota bacterium]